MFVAVLGALVATGHIHRAMRHSTATKLLIAWMLWGVLRTIPYIGIYKFNAIRDAALWYYAFGRDPRVRTRAPRRRARHPVGRHVPALHPLVPDLGPIALVMGSAIGTNLNLFVPGSSTSVFDHKPGNIAVQIAIVLAFLWLVPNAAGRYRPFLTGCSTVLLLVVFTQNRGGFIAASAGLAWVWLFAKRRGRMTLAIIATVALVIVSGWALNIQIKSSSGRTISVNQIVENFNSVTGGQEHTGRRQPQLDGAVPQEPLVGRDHEGEDREEGPHRARLRNRHRQGSRFPRWRRHPAAQPAQLARRRVRTHGSHRVGDLARVLGVLLLHRAAHALPAHRDRA